MTVTNNGGEGSVAAGKAAFIIPVRSFFTIQLSSFLLPLLLSSVCSDCLPFADGGRVRDMGLCRLRHLVVLRSAPCLTFLQLFRSRFLFPCLAFFRSLGSVCCWQPASCGVVAYRRGASRGFRTRLRTTLTPSRSSGPSHSRVCGPCLCLAPFDQCPLFDPRNTQAPSLPGSLLSLFSVFPGCLRPFPGPFLALGSLFLSRFLSSSLSFRRTINVGVSRGPCPALRFGLASGPAFPRFSHLGSSLWLGFWAAFLSVPPTPQSSVVGVLCARGWLSRCELRKCVHYRMISA